MKFKLYARNERDEFVIISIANSTVEFIENINRMKDFKVELELE